MKNKAIMATRKAYILTIGFLLLLALASCSPRHIVVPDHPNLSDKKGNFSETVLYVTLFNMKNQTKKDTEYYYTDSKNKFIEYLKAQNNFKDIHDATSKFTPPQNINYVTLEVQLTPHHTEHRTWILDIPFFFPFTGFWPVTPLWGKVSVDATAVINNTNGNPISKFDAQKEKEYKITFYSWYNKGPLEKALQECYEQSYTAISEEIREQSGAITRALEEDCWISAESTNNITAFESFLEGFPKAKHAAQAQAQLESLYFQQAEEVNTITAFEAFLKKYPKGKYAVEAKTRLEPLHFQFAQEENTIEAFEEYLKRYPEVEHAEIVKRRIESLYFQKARTENTVQAYEDFMKMYPKGELIAEAKESLHTLKAQIKSSKTSVVKKEGTQVLEVAPLKKESKLTWEAENGTIAGRFVDEKTGNPVEIKPDLFRFSEETLTEAESAKIREQLGRVETKTYANASFLITNVPPGTYSFFTYGRGLFGPEFTVSPGQITDLGTIPVK